MKQVSSAPSAGMPTGHACGQKPTSGLDSLEEEHKEGVKFTQDNTKRPQIKRPISANQ